MNKKFLLHVKKSLKIENSGIGYVQDEDLLICDFLAFSPHTKMVASTPSITSLGDNVQARKEDSSCSFF